MLPTLTIIFNAGTFDVQGLIITGNSTLKQSCFECIYRAHSLAYGCLILMDGGSTIHSYTYNLTISRLHMIECLSSVIPGVYRISVYDYKSESIVYTLRPAYQTIATINNAETSTDIVQSTSLIQTSTSCLPTTASCSMADQSQPLTTSGGVI